MPITKTTPEMSARGHLSQSQPHVSDPKSARQSAFLAIFTMIIAMLLLDLSIYSINTMATRHNSPAPSISNPIPPKFLQCNCESLLPEQPQDWVAAAPVATKLCFTANVTLGLISIGLLAIGFVQWIENALLISVVLRNHALAYGIGAVVVGLIFIHAFFMHRMKENDEWLLAINTIMGLALAGLAFGTMA